MISKLINGIKEKEAPIVVGLDPMLSYIPEAILKKAFDEYGETPEGAAQAGLTFNKGLVDAVCDLVPAVKPHLRGLRNGTSGPYHHRQQDLCSLR